MTPADTLRGAATRLREAAEAATSGPWFAVSSGVEGAGTVFHDGHVLHNDATYIALVDPVVGAKLADWLDAAAARLATGQALDGFALTVARSILGEEA